MKVKLIKLQIFLLSTFDLHSKISCLWIVAYRYVPVVLSTRPVQPGRTHSLCWIFIFVGYFHIDRRSIIFSFHDHHDAIRFVHNAINSIMNIGVIWFRLINHKNWRNEIIFARESIAPIKFRKKYEIHVASTIVCCLLVGWVTFIGNQSEEIIVWEHGRSESVGKDNDLQYDDAGSDSQKLETLLCKSNRKRKLSNSCDRKNST